MKRITQVILTYKPGPRDAELYPAAVISAEPNQRLNVIVYSHMIYIGATTLRDDGHIDSRGYEIPFTLLDSFECIIADIADASSSSRS